MLSTGRVIHECVAIWIRECIVTGCDLNTWKGEINAYVYAESKVDKWIRISCGTNLCAERVKRSVEWRRFCVFETGGPLMQPLAADICTSSTSNTYHVPGISVIWGTMERLEVDRLFGWVFVPWMLWNLDTYVTSTKHEITYTGSRYKYRNSGSTNWINAEIWKWKYHY